MADVLKLSPRVETELRDAEGTLDAGQLLKSEKGAILPCEHNAFVLIAADARYETLHFDEFLSRMRIDDARLARRRRPCLRPLAAIGAWRRAIHAWPGAQRGAVAGAFPSARFAARVCRRAADMGRRAADRNGVYRRLGRTGYRADSCGKSEFLRRADRAGAASRRTGGHALVFRRTARNLQVALAARTRRRLPRRDVRRHRDDGLPARIARAVDCRTVRTRKSARAGSVDRQAPAVGAFRPLRPEVRATRRIVPAAGRGGRDDERGYLLGGSDRRAAPGAHSVR